MNIALVGVGMGTPAAMTVEARDAIAAADAVIGSERLLTGLSGLWSDRKIITLALAHPEAIANAVGARPEWRSMCVLLSGDVGFHSGAKRLVELLSGHELRLVPGVSAPQYFAARLRRPWHDFHLVSAHGVACDIVAEALNHPAVLFLTGGAATPRRIAMTLCDAGLGEAAMTVGENLSGPDERITNADAARVAAMEFAPLSVVLVENRKTFRRASRVAGIEDDAFVRGQTPMTKREVRAVALALLRPNPGDILYDVGAGTGSVAVEMALAARRGRVYALEAKADACDLIEANKERFGVHNLCCIRGEAPGVLAGLPAATAAFIGGTNGAMREIMAVILAKNASTRLVASAICLETLMKALDAMRDLGVRGVEVRQIAVSRTVEAGGLHMLNALNPVFLVSGGGET